MRKKSCKSRSTDTKLSPEGQGEQGVRPGNVVLGRQDTSTYESLEATRRGTFRKRQVVQYAWVLEYVQGGVREVVSRGTARLSPRSCHRVTHGCCYTTVPTSIPDGPVSLRNLLACPWALEILVFLSICPFFPRQALEESQGRSRVLMSRLGVALWRGLLQCWTSLEVPPTSDR